MEIIKMIWNFIFCIVVLFLMGCSLYITVKFVWEIIKDTKKGIHNISKCDDELFEKIDFFRIGLLEDRNLYLRKIKIINYYYKPGGKVDNLVEAMEIERLYNRRDFLEKRCGSHEHLLSILISLWISVIVAVGSEVYKDKNIPFVLIGSIVISALFISLIFFKYRKRGEDGIYISQTYRYELKCLNEKIEKIESNEVCDEEEQEIFHTKQMVINKLVEKHAQVARRIKRKTIRNKLKEIEEDMETVERLKLYTDCDKDDIKIAFCIDEEIGYLRYCGQNKNGETISKMKLKGDFKILGNILLKYNIISKYKVR